MPSMIQEDAGLDKLFEEVIASPELNLLSDDFEQIDNSQDLIYPMPTAFPAHHPILHRIQHHPPLPLSILKSHALTTATTNPGVGPGTISTAGGGISPTLTWSGGPSPIEQDISPGLHDGDYVDIGESDGFAPLFSIAGQPDDSASVPARRRRSFGSQSTKTAPSARASRSRSIRNSSQSRSRSSRSTSANDDDLALSTLSLISSTSTHVDPANGEILHIGNKPGSRSGLSQPPSPTHDRRPVIDSPATHTRKKSRTLSRSSIDGVIGLTSEPGPNTSATDYAALIHAALASSMGSNTASNRLIPTGHRRNITSASLVPLDAPTQIRNYLTPSSTSKKDTPSAFVARKNKIKAKEAARVAATTPTRKRSRDDAGLGDAVGSLDDDNGTVNNGEGDDDDDTVDDGPTHDQFTDYRRSTHVTHSLPTTRLASFSAKRSDGNAPAGSVQDPSLTSLEHDISSETSSLLSAIEAKRRQNTLAARRSRQRKLDYVRNLEELLTVMTRERDEWKDRAERAESELGLMEED